MPVAIVLFQNLFRIKIVPHAPHPVQSKLVVQASAAHSKERSLIEVGSWGQEGAYRWETLSYLDGSRCASDYYPATGVELDINKQTVTLNRKCSSLGQPSALWTSYLSPPSSAFTQFLAYMTRRQGSPRSEALRTTPTPQSIFVWTSAASCASGYRRTRN
ncbi:hypothetical protein BC827DRAFT_1166243 [Russula dissimulans]|nr:hypothetical protein BC827DRAFT_1166243 [Russula dissimulans]